MWLDFASLESIRSFATEPAGHVNTGALPPTRTGVQRRRAVGNHVLVIVHSFEPTFGVNHLAGFCSSTF
jgi:hypothetical protein